MDQDKQPETVPQTQRRPRPPKTKPKFVALDVHLPKDSVAAVAAPPVDSKPAEPAVVNSDLGHFDVQAKVSVVITDRYGRVFQNEENVIMGGMLDPANRGILARGIEGHWEQMRGVVISTFGKLIDERVKAATPPAPAPETASPTNVKLAKTQQPITLAEIKPATLPTAKMPALSPMPPPAGK